MNQRRAAAQPVDVFDGFDPGITKPERVELDLQQSRVGVVQKDFEAELPVELLELEMVVVIGEFDPASRQTCPTRPNVSAAARARGVFPAGLRQKRQHHRRARKRLRILQHPRKVTLQRVEVRMSRDDANPKSPNTFRASAADERLPYPASSTAR